MSVDLKERDRPMRRDSPVRDSRASRDSKPPPMRDNRAVRDNITNRNDPHSVRCRIFLGNLPTDKMTREEVEDVFSQYGKVTAVSIHAHFGFVQYEDERSADSAVAKESGKVYYGKKLEVNLAGDRKKDSRPPERDGRPPIRDARSPFRDGRPPLREVRPPERERRPPPPFERRERDFDRERPRRSPPRDRYGEHNRFPPRFDGPPDRFRRSPSPPRDGFRAPYARHDDPYDRDRYRDDPYFREPLDRPPLDRRGPPDRRDIPMNDRRDFPPLDRRDYPDRHDDLGYGRGRPRSPPRHDGPPRDRHEDERDRRDPYDRPRGPYDERRDDYYRRDDPYSRDYPPVKKPRTDYDLPLDDAYSSSKTSTVPTDCVIVVMNKQQRGYAEMVERRLKASGLVVDLKYDVAKPLTELLDSVARNGVLYAIVITSQHEVHRSVTVNILHGTPQEHRNMPLEDAMRFVGQNFDRYMQDLRERSKKSSLSSLESGSATSGTATAQAPAPAPAPAPTTTTTTTTRGNEISDLLSRAASGETLTSDQLSTLIDNLSKQQKEMSGTVGANGGQGGAPANTTSQAASQPATDAQSIAKQQAELQAKILSILNPGAKTAMTNLTSFQTQQSAQKPAEPMASKSTIAPLYPPAKPTFPAYGTSPKVASTTTSTAVAAAAQYRKPSSISTVYGVSSAPAVSKPQYVPRTTAQSAPFTVSPQSSGAKSAVSSAYKAPQAHITPQAHARSPVPVLRSTSAAGYPPKSSPGLLAYGATSAARTPSPQTLPRTLSGGVPRPAGSTSILGAPAGTARPAAPPGTLPRPRLAAPGAAARHPSATGMPAPRVATPRGASVSGRGAIPTRGAIAPLRGGVSSAPSPRGGLGPTRGAVRGAPAQRGAPFARGSPPSRGVPRGAVAGRGLVRGAPMGVGRAGIPRGRGIMGHAPRGTPISTIMNRRGVGRGH